MMRLRRFICAVCVIGCASLGEKPDPTKKADTARWLLKQADWGMMASLSLHLNGTAFGNPISVADAMLDGKPYFYVSKLDATIQDLAVDPRCTLALSEAAIDCATLQLDPEDPRCARLSLSGKMLTVTDQNEFSKAKAALFDRHPQMKSWPADHNWLVQKMQVEKIWLIDFFGGAADIPVSEYVAGTPPADLTPVNASTRRPIDSKPWFFEEASTARWLVHQSLWGFIATTSIHLNGAPFGNMVSMSDGAPANASGTPYFYVSSLDTSMEDMVKNPAMTLTLSEASVDCLEKKLDPEDPRCVRLSLTGKMVNVTDSEEAAFAKNALFTSHPQMAKWPASHDFRFTKLEISKIWLIDMFGGAKDIAVEKYFKASTSPSLVHEYV